MSAAVTWLLDAALGTFLMGGCIWYGLCVGATILDPRRVELLSFNLNRQWAANLRIFATAGAIGRRTGLARIANILLAIAACCLMAAGIAKVISLIVAKQGGAA